MDVGDEVKGQAHHDSDMASRAHLKACKRNTVEVMLAGKIQGHVAVLAASVRACMGNMSAHVGEGETVGGK